MSLPRSRVAGFTMVELMIVVVIIGILATVAVYGVRMYVRSARAAEAYNMIGSIKAGEEAYRDETYQYFDVSEDSWDNAAPDVPGRNKQDFAAGASATEARFKVIGVRPSAPVYFSYAVVAGAAGATPRDPAMPDQTFNWAGSAATAPWYVIRVRGNLDEDSEFSMFVASSFTDEVTTHNARE